MTASYLSENTPAEILPPLSSQSFLPPLQSWHTTTVTTGALGRTQKQLFYKLVIANWEHIRHALSRPMPPTIIQEELTCTQAQAHV